MYLYEIAVIIISFHFVYCDKTYISQEYPSSYYFFQLPMSFDTYKVLLSINTFNNFTWLSKSVKRDFKYINATLIGNTSFVFERNKRITADIFSLPLRFINENIVIDDFHMYINNIQDWAVCNSGYGFGFKFENENFSIIHKLYETKYINKKQFSFIQTSTPTSGKIILGEVSQMEINNIEFIGKCNVIQDNIYWSCGIKYIQFETEICGNNNTIIEVAFHSVTKYSIHSEQIVKIVRKVLGNKCEDIIYNANENRLLCDKQSIFNSKYYIHFVFEYIIDIPLNMLFQCNSKENTNKCISTFLYIFNDKSIQHILNPNTKIIFGSFFFKLFKLITFNYDNKSITFYSNTINISPYNNTNTILHLINITLYILIPFTLIQLIIYYYIHLKT